jgi:hypothetical protein
MQKFQKSLVAFFLIFIIFHKSFTQHNLLFFLIKAWRSGRVVDYNTPTDPKDVGSRPACVI